MFHWLWFWLLQTVMLRMKPIIQLSHLLHFLGACADDKMSRMHKRVGLWISKASALLLSRCFTRRSHSRRIATKGASAGLLKMFGMPKESRAS